MRLPGSSFLRRIPRGRGAAGEEGGVGAEEVVGQTHAAGAEGVRMLEEAEEDRNRAEEAEVVRNRVEEAEVDRKRKEAEVDRKREEAVVDRKREEAVGVRMLAAAVDAVRTNAVEEAEGVFYQTKLKHSSTYNTLN